MRTVQYDRVCLHNPALLSFFFMIIFYYLSFTILGDLLAAPPLRIGVLATLIAPSYPPEWWVYLRESQNKF